MYQQVQALREEINNAEQKMKHYLGHDLGLGPGPGPLLLEELHKHEQQLESSLSLIRARKEQMLQHDNGNMYHWLMGAGQVHEQQQQQVPEQLPLYGEDEPINSTVLQLATTSSSSQFFPFHLHATQPHLQDYGNLILLSFCPLLIGFSHEFLVAYLNLPDPAKTGLTLGGVVFVVVVVSLIELLSYICLL
ncbi:hypothetical protein Cgig2_015982 [Carnegiea gigantea]|uniref:K-box domain-containing protein n=1 Tax=Carnegiea gigantea TaxID=171969 RepID=A0A9Q1KNY7_9CARY|nr:hypothetical protein Cgig2_015982 [Carnegiea gigantea]